jgi:hypothetical protein
MSSFCELTAACCQKDGASNLDPSFCKQELQLLGFSRDGTLRAACLADLEQRAADQSCIPEWSSLDDPCVRTFNEPGGTQPPGGPCKTTVDCAGAAGTITKCWENSFGPGVCIRMSPGKAGQGTCLGDVVATAGGGFFGPFLGPGGSGWPPAITVGVYCDERAGLTCFPNTDLTAQVCAPLLADRAPCSFGFNCASQICWDGSGPVTGTETGVCMTRVSDGQQCSGVTETCASASYCKSAPSGTATCAPKESSGASCSSADACASGNCRALTTCSAIPLAAAALFCQ